MLKGKTIIITRPAGSEDLLGKALKELGAALLYMPLIKTMPVELPPQSLINIEKNHPYQWLVFTSRNGVRHFFDQYQGALDAPSLPFKIAVFGERTAMALEERGMKPDVQNFQNTSYDLLNDLYAALKIGDKILLVLGNLASDILEKNLKAKVEVDRINVYQTLFVSTINQKVLNRIKQEDYDLILFTSPSGYHSFKQQMNKDLPWDQLKIACIGPSTEKAILLDGIKPLITARPSGREGLIREITNHFMDSKSIVVSE